MALEARHAGAARVSGAAVEWGGYLRTHHPVTRRTRLRRYDPGVALPADGRRARRARSAGSAAAAGAPRRVGLRRERTDRRRPGAAALRLRLSAALAPARLRHHA